MISKVGPGAIRNTYQESEAKEASKRPSTVDKQGDTSKIEQLKSSIANRRLLLTFKNMYPVCVPGFNE